MLVSLEELMEDPRAVFLPRLRQSSRDSVLRLRDDFLEKTGEIFEKRGVQIGEPFTQGQLCVFKQPPMLRLNVPYILEEVPDYLNATRSEIDALITVNPFVVPQPWEFYARWVGGDYQCLLGRDVVLLKMQRFAAERSSRSFSITRLGQVLGLSSMQGQADLHHIASEAGALLKKGSTQSRVVYGFGVELLHLCYHSLPDGSGRLENRQTRGDGYFQEPHKLPVSVEME